MTIKELIDKLENELATEHINPIPDTYRMGIADGWRLCQKSIIELLKEIKNECQ